MVLLFGAIDKRLLLKACYVQSVWYKGVADLGEVVFLVAESVSLRLVCQCNARKPVPCNALLMYLRFSCSEPEPNRGN
jgi:hypothetical protein